MPKNMRDLFYEKTEGYTSIELLDNTSLKDIEKLGEGIYILNKIPSIDLIKQFPYIYDSNGEVGLICIENIWLMTLSKKKQAYVPAELNGYITKGGVQFFAHSHPGEDSSAKFPSFSDLNSCNSIDHCIYIINYKGLSEINISGVDNFFHLDEKWENFLQDEKILKENYELNKETVYNDFFNYIGCKSRIISFDNEKEIQTLLNDKMSLTCEFWDKELNFAPYPGKSR
jgi:hypothetical protein